MSSKPGGSTSGVHRLKTTREYNINRVSQDICYDIPKYSKKIYIHINFNENHIVNEGLKMLRLRVEMQTVVVIS